MSASRPKEWPSDADMEVEREMRTINFLEATKRLERLKPHVAAAQKRVCAATTYTKPSTRADFEEGHRRRKIALKRLNPLLEMQAKFIRTKMGNMKKAAILERRLNSAYPKPTRKEL
jgi:hypothetical protein